MSSTSPCRFCCCVACLQPVAATGTAQVESALSAAFPEANSTLRKRAGLDADLSGSTGIVAVISPNRLTAANLGDSRCVLGEHHAQWALVCRLFAAVHCYSCLNTAALS